VHNRGFSLIELMVTVAIVAILAAVAYPAYQNHVVKTRRAAAQACLLELAQFMERYYATNLTYIGATLPNTACRSDLAAHYTFGFSGNPTATAFTLQATAQGTQATRDAACSPLTVTVTGARGPNGCW
jgi:type IV pilus assembly protein PilE